MHSEVRFEAIKEILQPLRLREGDFTAGNDLTIPLGQFKSAIEALEPAEDPWVIRWLADEHQRGATLYVAAKVNWTHEKLVGSSVGDRRTRGAIIARFNAWVQQLLQRLATYEAGDGTASSVERWLDELATFKQDPIQSP